jgi:hypothetical protein
VRPYEHSPPPALVENVAGGPRRPFPSMTIAEADAIASALEDAAEATRQHAGSWLFPGDDKRTMEEAFDDVVIDMAIAEEREQLALRVRRWCWDVAGAPAPSRVSRVAGWLAGPAAFGLAAGSVLAVLFAAGVPLLAAAAASGFVGVVAEKLVDWYGRSFWRTFRDDLRRTFGGPL